MSNPITDQELDELGELLFKYGNDDAILDVSELDGFVNALCSSPHMLPPSEWLPEVSGGKLPRFKSKAQAQRYTDLIIKFYNTVAIMLSEATDELNLFFEVRDTAQGEIVVLEEWCFGYMRVFVWDDGQNYLPIFKNISTLLPCTVRRKIFPSWTR